MNTKRSIGVLLDSGAFDNEILNYIAIKLETMTMLMQAKGETVSRASLARELGILPNRLVRIAKAVDMTHLFR
jgi:hypothetical protein